MSETHDPHCKLLCAVDSAFYGPCNCGAIPYPDCPWEEGKPITKRRPYVDDEPDGYLEGDYDYMANNLHQAVWFLDNGTDIINALKMAELALRDYGLRHHGGTKALAHRVIVKILRGES